MCRTFVLTALVIVGITSSVAVAQEAQFAYVGSANSDNLMGYKINPVTGELAPLPGFPFATGSPGASIFTIDQAGRFLYMSEDQGIIGFRIDPVTGKLTKLPGSPFAPGNEADSLAIDPSGQYLYAVESQVNNVMAYRISATGKLTALPSAPLVGEQNNPASVTVDPLGKFVYVTDYDAPTVSGFTLNPASGALTPILGSPFSNGVVGAYPLAIDPLDRFAYSAQSNISILGYTMDATTGVLTPLPGAFGGITGPEFPVVDPRGKFLYVGSETGLEGYTIQQYNLDLDSQLGDLTPLAGPPAGPAANQSQGFSVSMAVDYTGTFVYDTYSTSGVFGFKINPATGVVTVIPGSPFATAGTLSTIALARPQTTPVYTAKQIPEPNFGPFSSFTGSAINNKGEVTGQAVFAGQFLAETLLYNGSTTNGLFLNDGRTSVGNALNNKGEIVGTSVAPSAGPFFALPQAFLYRSASGATFALDPRQGGESTAQGINDAEHITGSISTGVCGFSFDGSCPGLGNTHAFFDYGRGPKDIGTLGGDFSEGFGINDHDEIVGASNLKPNGPNHVFIYSHGSFHDVGMFDHYSSVGTAINDRGQIIGSATPPSGALIGFAEWDGWFQPLPKLQYGSYSLPAGINLQGDVVGTSDVGSGGATHAFLYCGGKLLDLNNLVEPSLTLLTGATAINDRGQIVVSGLNGALYVLTPRW